MFALKLSGIQKNIFRLFNLLSFLIPKEKSSAPGKQSQKIRNAP